MVGGKKMIKEMEIIDNLLFVDIWINHRGKRKNIDKVLIDTGSATTIIKMDIVDELDIKPEDDDRIGSIAGVGGSEFVYFKEIDEIEIGGHKIEKFTIDIGAMDYGFEINGIIGLDLLLKIKSIIDLETMLLKCKVGQ